VRITDETIYTSNLKVYAHPRDRAHATDVLAALVADAEGARNLYRGRAMVASVNNGLRLELTELPPSPATASSCPPRSGTRSTSTSPPSPCAAN
jgi:hypothetical protein